MTGRRTTRSRDCTGRWYRRVTRVRGAGGPRACRRRQRRARRRLRPTATAVRYSQSAPATAWNDDSPWRNPAIASSNAAPPYRAHAYWNRPPTTGITVPVPGQSTSSCSNGGSTNGRSQASRITGAGFPNAPRPASKRDQRSARPAGPPGSRATRSRSGPPRSPDRTRPTARAPRARRERLAVHDDAAPCRCPCGGSRRPSAARPPSGACRLRAVLVRASATRRAAGTQRVAHDGPPVGTVLEQHVVPDAHAVGASHASRRARSGCPPRTCRPRCSRPGDRAAGHWRRPCAWSR